jgi:hypothetical protein
MRAAATGVYRSYRYRGVPARRQRREPGQSPGAMTATQAVLPAARATRPRRASAAPARHGGIDQS